MSKTKGAGEGGNGIGQRAEFAVGQWLMGDREIQVCASDKPMDEEQRNVFYDAYRGSFIVGIRFVLTVCK